MEGQGVPTGDPPLADDEQTGVRSWSTERWATIVFWAAVAVAVPVIRYQSRNQWFFLDEWDFLSGRELRSADDLLRPHNEHWTTLPIVVYRLLFRVVGLNHYWPYQAVAIGTHLGVAAMMRAVMRRSGVDPWIATTLAVLLVFLGAGRENIAWGFQIAFTGALLLGLAHMVLADHDGRFGGRDGLGIACGVGALMCSGVGVAMAFGVGLSVLLRRGWRMAIAHTAPLAVVYGLWWVAQRPSSAAADGATLASVIGFSRMALANAFIQLGGSSVWAVGVVVLVVAAIALTWSTHGHRLPSPPPLAAGVALSGVGFVLATALGRSGLELINRPKAERYVYLVIAFALPTIGLAASIVVRGHLWARVALIALLLAGLPGNLRMLEPAADDPFAVGYRATWEQYAALAVEGGYPPEGHPSPVEAPDVTMRWLSQTAAAGRLTPASSVPPDVVAAVTLATSLTQIDAATSRSCEPRPSASPLRVRRGQQIQTRSPQVTVARVGPGPPLTAVGFLGTTDVALDVLRGPLELQVTVPPGEDATLAVCG